MHADTGRCSWGIGGLVKFIFRDALNRQILSPAVRFEFEKVSYVIFP